MMSGHAWIKFLKTKDEQDAAFREYTAWLERQTGLQQARMGGNNDSDEDDGVRASRTKSLDMNRIRTPP
ncbi:hypothetical protein Ae201684P_016573 [Aphanomyces euteiches]|nr:hypothetical protein Ae201684P_016573 [Aphanomyces euteiches]